MEQNIRTNDRNEWYSYKTWIGNSKKNNRNIFSVNLSIYQEETDHSQGSADFAKLIHKSYLSDKEKILVDALTEYKRVGYKRSRFIWNDIKS